VTCVQSIGAQDSYFMIANITGIEEAEVTRILKEHGMM
jgi:hypothetical protein